MPGLFNNIIEGEVIWWADASLRKLEASYEEVILHISEENGRQMLIHCNGYIGFQVVGFWDEVIVERAMLYLDHPFISECENKVKTALPSGAESRSKDGNCLLEIVFIDGCKILVCANRFRCKLLL